MTLPILEHIEELRKKAVKENEPQHKKMKKWGQYYTGDFGNSQQTQLNITKGIIDTKVAFILDNEIVSSVTPKAKSFANLNEVGKLDDIADILNDCNSHILDKNNFDDIKKEVITNKEVYGKGIVETYWEQDSDDELGDVKLVSIDPLNFYPDTSAKKIQDANYVFIREVYSSITLKKLYPQFIEQIDKAKKVGDSETKQDSQANKAIITVGDEFNTSQIYSDGKSPEGKISQSENVIVWKCYLKDDSTFISDDSEKQELMFQYPNGRMLKFVEGATDYILDDKPIDYPFGFPIDIIKSESTVKYIVDIQDRINKAFTKIRYLVGGLLSFLEVTPDSGLSEQDIINQLVIEVEALGQIGVITNNTTDALKEMVSYIEFLKEQAYEITRVNPAMISGKKEDGVKSGKMIEALNDSPLTAIREVQRSFKHFVISQGNKNIVLIQLYYKVPRIVRLSGGDLAYIYPQNEGAGQQQNPTIEIYKKNAQKQYEAIQTIEGDLSIGEYEVEVIAGTEMPRSRGEKAQLLLQLSDMGKIPNTMSGTEILLDALDIPDKSAIIEANEEAEMNAPKINIPLELAGKIFKDMPPLYQDEFLQQFGFSPNLPEGGIDESI